MKSQSEVGKAALERCPYCHAAYVHGSDDVCPKARERHSFVEGICNVNVCGRCDEPRDAHQCPGCQEQHDPGDGSCTQRILERRRAIMPDYDKKLEEWLS